MRPTSSRIPSTLPQLQSNVAHSKLTPSQQTLADRINEYKSFQAVDTATLALAGSLDSMSTQIHSLSSGSEAVAKVLTNWDQVFRATQLAMSNLSDRQDRDVRHAVSDEAPEQLVRIPVDPLNQDDPPA